MKRAGKILPCFFIGKNFTKPIDIYTHCVYNEYIRYSKAVKKGVKMKSKYINNIKLPKTTYTFEFDGKIIDIIFSKNTMRSAFVKGKGTNASSTECYKIMIRNMENGEIEYKHTYKNTELALEEIKRDLMELL